jgi:glycosyltransferase involved in cell wall biosynthesis
MFSVIIPTFNNIDYLKLCIKSLKINSAYEHELIFHINEGTDGTLEYLKKSKYKFSYSKINTGVCVAFNEAVKLAKSEYVVLGHDDMYFCPGWDTTFVNELKKIREKNFFLSGTMVQAVNSDLVLDCGKTNKEFNEDKLLSELPKIAHSDFQGTHWQPSLIPIDTWNKVKGFSEEFSPGLGSDPDFNYKLWNIGTRLFKGLGNCRVYHFSSISLRKKSWNNGAKTFLLKWGISIKFFRKHYLRVNTKYDGLLKNPIKDFIYYKDLIICKFKYCYFFLINKIKR